MGEGLGIPLGLSDSQCLPTSDAFKPACAVSSPARPPFLGCSSPFFQGTNQGHVTCLLVLTGIASHWSLPLPFQPVGMNHTLTKSSRGERSMRPDGAPWNPNRGLSAQKTPQAQQVKEKGREESYLLLSTMFPSFKSLCTMFFYKGKTANSYYIYLNILATLWRACNLTITIAVYYRKTPCTIIQLNLGWITQ